MTRHMALPRRIKGGKTCAHCKHMYPKRFLTCPRCMWMALQGLDTAMKDMEGKR